MNLKYAPKFKRNIRHFLPEVQEKFYKQVELLRNDLRHPSLHAKKFDERQDVWQARVDRSVRFYFTTKRNVILLLDIRHHPK